MKYVKVELTPEEYTARGLKIPENAKNRELSNAFRTQVLELEELVTIRDTRKSRILEKLKLERGASQAEMMEAIEKAL